MTKHNQKLFALAAFASIGLSASPAFAQDVVVDGKGEIPYVIDGRNVVARSGANLCWRTGYWTPAAAETAMAGQFPAGCGCDGDIVPKAKCEAVAPAPVVAPAVVPTPVPTKELAGEKVRLNADFLFDFDQALLKPEGRTALDNVAAQAAELKLEVVIVTGHTDRLGSVPYNQRLSERRAAAVKSYLVSKGIDSSLVYTEGKGKAQPVSGNQCDNIRVRKQLVECLQQDRRVDIEMVGTRR